MDNFKRKSGMTLIELVIVVTLLVVIIAAIVSFSFYGTSTFSSSSSQARIQGNVRTVAYYIAKEIRNCDDITVVDSADPQYKGFKLTGTTFSGFVDDGSSNTAPNIDSISEVSFIFRKTENSDRVVLHLTVTGKSGQNEYKLDTNILLNNLPSSEIESGFGLDTNFNLSSGTIFYFP